MRRPFAALLVVAVVALHLLPGSATPSGNDKLGHVAMGAAVAAAFLLLGHGERGARSIDALLHGLLLLASLEVAQAFVPGRTVSAGDLVADAAGVVAVAAVTSLSAAWPRASRA